MTRLLHLISIAICLTFAVYAHSATYTYCEAETITMDNYVMPSTPNAKLIHLNLLTRHGDRTPASIMPFDDAVYNLCNNATLNSVSPQKEFATISKMTNSLSDSDNPFDGFAIWKGNCFDGQLTSKGMEQLKNIGRNLRQVYGDTLGFIQGKEFDPSTVYVRSTDYWRTQQSAQSLLSELFSLSKDIFASSIPVVVYPSAIETMVPNPSACPALADLFYDLETSAAWKNHISDHADLFARLESAFNTAGLSSWQGAYSQYFDNMQVRTCHNMSLPCGLSGDCVSNDDFNTVVSMGEWEYLYMFTMWNQSAVARLAVSPFVKSMVNNFVNADSSKVKLHYYSAHDTTIAALLGAFNFTNWRWPPYASQVILELWQPGPFVRFIYNGEVMQMPFCSDIECPMSEFLSYFENLFPSDYMKDCGVSNLFSAMKAKDKKRSSPMNSEHHNIRYNGVAGDEAVLHENLYEW